MSIRIISYLYFVITVNRENRFFDIFEDGICSNNIHKAEVSNRSSSLYDLFSALTYLMIMKRDSTNGSLKMVVVKTLKNSFALRRLGIVARNFLMMQRKRNVRRSFEKNRKRLRQRRRKKKRKKLQKMLTKSLKINERLTSNRLWKILRLLEGKGII